MRQIIFKAKRLDNGQWVEGNLVSTPKADEEFKCIIIPCDENGEYTDKNDLGFETWSKVDPSTICQYTGLIDINKNKIWENDICKCIEDGTIITRIIVWDEQELDFKATNGDINYGREFNYLSCCYVIEVIGNIFDNTELLQYIEKE